MICAAEETHAERVSATLWKSDLLSLSVAMPAGPAESAKAGGEAF
jgi:hypothetical protein